MGAKGRRIASLGSLLSGLASLVFASGDPALPTVPAEYATKHMPAGWWTNPDVLREGKEIFEEKTRCADCHGKDGNPVVRGTSNLRSAKRFNRYSDSHWFWRISEGVPRTAMMAWRDLLTEEERWKVIAYAHTFSHGGRAEPHDHPEISP